MTSSPETHWPTIHNYVARSLAFAKDMAFRCADDFTHEPIIKEVAEEQLGEMYRWLSTVCPPETDVFERAAFVGPAHLAHELRQRLERRRVVVNREVVIRPTDEGDSCERQDIKLDVVGNAKHAAGPAVTVPVEIKGAWHDKVLSAQSEQLEQQYLSVPDTTDGIYLVGWYPISHWNAHTKEDSRKSAARRHGSAEALRAHLLQQAMEIAESTHCRTHPLVLIVEQAVSADDRAMRAPSSPRTPGKVESTDVGG